MPRTSSQSSATELYRATGSPSVELDVATLLAPPSPDEVVEHAGRVAYAG